MLTPPRPADEEHVGGVLRGDVNADARERCHDAADDHDVDLVEDAGPIQIVGTGATVNDATQNAFDRAGKLLDMSEGEVRSRCTFTGGVQIGRLPGVVQLDVLAPMDVLEERGIAHLVQEQYGTAEN